MGQQQDPRELQGKRKKKDETLEEDLPDTLESDDLDDSHDEDRSDQGLRRWN